MKRTQNVGKSTGKNKTKMRIYKTREAMRIAEKMAGILLGLKEIISILNILIIVSY